MAADRRRLRWAMIVAGASVALLASGLGCARGHGHDARGRRPAAGGERGFVSGESIAFVVELDFITGRRWWREDRGEQLSEDDRPVEPDDETMARAVAEVLRLRARQLQVSPFEAAPRGPRILGRAVVSDRAAATRLLQVLARPGRFAIRPIVDETGADAFIDEVDIAVDGIGIDSEARPDETSAITRQRYLFVSDEVALPDLFELAGSIALGSSDMLLIGMDDSCEELRWRTFHVRSSGSGDRFSVAAAQAVIVAGEAPTVRVELSERGDFSDLTGAHVGRRLALVLDDAVISAPEVRGRIDDGSFVMSPLLRGDREEDAQDVAAILTAGSLAASVVAICEIPPAGFAAPPPCARRFGGD